MTAAETHERSATVAGKVQFREYDYGRRPRRDEKRTPMLREVVAKVHSFELLLTVASAWPWKGGRCMRTLTKTGGPPAPLKGLKRKRPVIYRRNSATRPTSLLV